MESFLYLLIILIVFMVVIRFFIPLLVYLIPVIFIAYLIAMLVRYIKNKHANNDESVYQDEDYTYQSYQQQDPDIIDVDYKVIKEEENEGKS